MGSQSKVAEVDLAELVVDYLREQGWEVYQEVQDRFGSRVADIVGTKGNEVCIVEVKASFTAALLEQAWNWRGSADYLYVAAPQVYRRVAGRKVLWEFCRVKGIGVLQWIYGGKIEQSVPAEKKPRIVMLDCFKGVLCEEHKTFCKAGSANGGHFTPFKATCRDWKKYVEAHPGCTLKEVAEGAGHHYASLASATGNMGRFIEGGKVVPGIRSDRTNGRIRLYLSVEAQ